MEATGSQWTRVFFIAWWIVGVCVLLNVLVSLILEAFIDAWKKEKDNREFAISARKTRRQESGLNSSSALQEDLDIFQDLGDASSRFSSQRSDYTIPQNVSGPTQLNPT